MNLFITYSEIKSLVYRQTAKQVDLKMVDANTIAVTVGLLKKVLNVAIPLSLEMQVQVVKVEQNVLTLAFVKKRIRDKLIEIILPYISDISNLPFLYFDENDNYFSIDLNRIEKVQKALEYIDLRDVSFEQDGVLAKAELKELL